MPNLEETSSNVNDNASIVAEENENAIVSEELKHDNSNNNNNYEDDETEQRQQRQEQMEQLESSQNEAIQVEKTEEELALERQLADVQRQLAALSNLPSTIQSTLDAVTKQLADILPTFKLQQQQTETTAVRATNLEKIDEAEARAEGSSSSSTDNPSLSVH